MRDKPAPVGATWFTNLSDFQVQAIEGLNFAIRDDEAEATVYRTQFCLSRLGVTPMVKARMLRKLIMACRRSDLAFLYFLLEACYKGAGFEYSERIIMSAITYLDLEMTMRELDRILPPGVERLNSKSQSSSQESSLAKRYTVIRPSFIATPPKDVHARPARSPYFMPLPKPKPPPASVSSFGSRPPRHVVTFPFWPAGERPKYKVNDESRWFAQYKFQPVRRMLLGILGDIMTDYWTQVGGGSEVDKEAPLCKFHQEAQRQEEQVQKEALVNAHELCLKLVDITSRDDAALRKRIVAQLDKDIEDCTLRWQRLRQRHLTDVMLIEDHDQMCAMGKVPTAAEKDRHLYMWHEADVGTLSVAPTMSVHQITGKGVVSQLTKMRVSDPEDDIPCPIQPEDEKLSKCPPQILGHRKPGKRVSITPNIVQGDRLPKCQKQAKPGRFFKAPRRGGPFVFNYHEIPPREDNPAPRDVMRRQVLRSLREPPDSCSTSDDGYNARMQPRDQVVAAIVECAQEMWFGSLEAHQRNQESSTKSTKSTNLVQSPTTCQHKEELDWTKSVEHFDPDDRQMMDRLLRDGFAELRKDPRCVYAAFPNSHKSNVMREWIKRRYGKTYSWEEIGQVVMDTLPTFHSVENKLNFAPSLRRDGFHPLEDTYDDHARLVALAKEIKTNYRLPLNDRILALTRFCWTALNPHLVTGSSLLNSFFAYLPVRYADMLR